MMEIKQLGKVKSKSVCISVCVGPQKSHHFLTGSRMKQDTGQCKITLTKKHQINKYVFFQRGLHGNSLYTGSRHEADGH